MLRIAGDIVQIKGNGAATLQGRNTTRPPVAIVGRHFGHGEGHADFRSIAEFGNDGPSNFHLGPGCSSRKSRHTRLDFLRQSVSGLRQGGGWFALDKLASHRWWSSETRFTQN